MSNKRTFMLFTIWPFDVFLSMNHRSEAFRASFPWSSCWAGLGWAGKSPRVCADFTGRFVPAEERANFPIQLVRKLIRKFAEFSLLREDLVG